MSDRKAIAKRIRFEVFKRDSFTCQYCGAKAPEAVLVIDHIKPVASGGGNEIMNLITACQGCNSGKGPRELSDDSAVAKQRRQLEELNQRREQLEMLLQWRDGLNDLESQKVDAVEQRIRERTGWGVNENGRQDLRKWVRRYGLDEVLDAVEISFDQYLEWQDEKPVSDTWNKAFAFIPRIVSVRRRQSDKPYLRDLFYIRGILRNRLNYCRDAVAMSLLEQAVEAGASIDNLREFAKAVQTWSQFTDEIHRFLEENRE